ncbi:MAG: hypothetical protein R2854_30985 [Caldilineaceae bacterium]
MAAANLAAGVDGAAAGACLVAHAGQRAARLRPGVLPLTPGRAGAHRARCPSPACGTHAPGNRRHRRHALFLAVALIIFAFLL